MSGLLAVSGEPLRDRMAGPAIRMLELSRAVARAGLPATLLSLTACEISDPAVDLAAVDRAGLRDRVRTARELGCAVLIQGDVLNLHPWLADVDVPIVVDAYDPFHLEQLEQARPLGETRRRIVVRDCVAALNRQLSRADLVLAGSDRQRDLWLGHLAALGRVNPVTYDDDHHLAGLLRIVPFGVPDGVAEPAAGAVMRGVLPGVDAGSVIALWTGGLYEWFDPMLVLEAVAAAAADGAAAADRLRLVFLGTSHPVLGEPTPTELAVRERAAELGLIGSVVHLVDRWVPYDERAGWLAEADIAVLAHRPGLETEFAFRTRVLDHLWAGLPTVGTAGDVLVDRVAATGAGVAVPPGDTAGFAAALAALAGSPTARAEAATLARELADEYRWDRVAEPLVEFCRAPRRAPDLTLPAAARAVLGLPRHPARRDVVERVQGAIGEGGAGELLRRATRRVTPGS